MRHHLMFGEHGRALEVLTESPVAPRDRLLRALQEGVVLHRAGEHEKSNLVLEWAEGEADRRYTKSVTRAAASLLLNDGVMAYSPSAAEMAMIPFYRMLNYLALGDRDGALVEARKANGLLARLERDPLQRCREDGMVQYLAGLVQRLGGETNDALVSFRLAEAWYSQCGAAPGGAVPAAVALDLARTARALGMPEVADSASARHALPAPAPADTASGELVVVLEHGFVAHRAERALHVPIFPEEIEGLEGGDSDGIAAAAGRIAERLLRGAWEREAWGEAWDDVPAVQWAAAAEGAYVLRLAWPVARLEPSRPAGVRVWVNDSLAVATGVGDLSEVVSRDLEAQRPRMLARLVARGLAKYLVSRELEKKAEKEGGELAGFLAGRLSNLAANELEQADTRSWSLLPDRVSLARATLPAGEYRVRVETLGADGRVLGERDLGMVRVERGAVVLLSERVWGYDGS